MPLPEFLGKYKVQSLLGAGGFGEVYLALDPQLNDPVAIKVFRIKDKNLAQQITSSSTDLAQVLKSRFLEEAKILRQLGSSEFIVSVYEFGELEDGTPFYVMPYMERSLEAEIGKDIFTNARLQEVRAELHPRSVPLPAGILWLTQIAQGLALVHKKGLIHRDIKPANILFDEQGRPQLCDFGIAKTPRGDHSQSGIGMGTPNYMSPEQEESAKYVEASSDVYSLGVLGIRMLTGTLPKVDARPPIAFVPNMGEKLNQLLLDATAFKPEQRPQDAQEFYDRLVAAQQDQEPVSEDDDTVHDGASAYVQEGATTTIDPKGAVSVDPKFDPVQKQIEQFLRQSIRLSEQQKEQIKISAGILDVTDQQLDSLITLVEERLEPELKPLRNFLQVLETELKANNGVLSLQKKDMLLESGVQLGLELQVMEGLIKQHAPKVEEVQAAPSQRDANKKKPTFLIAGAASVLVVGLVAFFLYGTSPSKQVNDNELADGKVVDSVTEKPKEESAKEESKVADQQMQPASVESGFQLPIPAKPKQIPAESTLPEKVVDVKDRVKLEEEKTFQLELFTNPTDASIRFLDGERRKYVSRMKIPVGRYQVEVSHPDYIPKRIPVHSEGEFFTRQVILTPKEKETPKIVKKEPRSSSTIVKNTPKPKKVVQPTSVDTTAEWQSCKEISGKPFSLTARALVKLPKSSYGHSAKPTIKLGRFTVQPNAMRRLSPKDYSARYCGGSPCYEIKGNFGVHDVSIHHGGKNYFGQLCFYYMDEKPHVFVARR